MKLQNERISVDVNDNGAVTGFVLNNDRFNANFILSSKDEKWVPENKQWGLGFISVGDKHIQISTPTSIEQKDNLVKAVYNLSFTQARFGCVWDGDIEKSKVSGNVELTVTRELKEDGMYESYEYKNTGDKYLVFDEIGIYSSFRDTYSSGKNCLETHMNEHICTCGDLCYIEAVRQSGNGQNTALITLEGNFSSYQIEEQNTSNTRGIIALISKDIRVAAGGIYKISRVITPFDSRKNFEEKLCKYTGYPIIDYGYLTIQNGEAFRFCVNNPGLMTAIKINGQTLEEKDGIYSYTPDALGVHYGKIYYGNRIAKITLYVLDSIDTLIKKRVKFILDKQQMNDKDDLRYGAFMPYDTVNEKIVKIEDIESIYFGAPDRNDARERMGMGAFIAIYARLYNDKSVIPALKKYSDYLCKYIVDDNGDVWDSHARQEGSKYYENGLLLTHEGIDMRFRSHNYAFIVPFFIEMYKLTGESFYAEKALTVLNKFYEKFSKFSIGFIQSLSEILNAKGNLDIEKNKGIIDNIKKYTKKTTENICSKGDSYEADEVSYEQGHPSTAALYLENRYFETEDISLIPHIDAELKRTTMFDGNQPDYLLNALPIRHWDGFWFGMLELWGDTFPHWLDWSSAVAYANYHKITGNDEFIKKANKIFNANFSLINSDGSAACCYIYNEKSNGRAGGRPDPLCNDQDWIYYYYLKMSENIL